MEAILQQLIWLCYSMWLFYLHSVLKIQPFSPVFLLARATDKAFCRLSLWNFKKKHQPFSTTQPILYNHLKLLKTIFLWLEK